MSPTSTTPWQGRPRRSTGRPRRSSTTAHAPGSARRLPRMPLALAHRDDAQHAAGLVVEDADRVAAGVGDEDVVVGIVHLHIAGRHAHDLGVPQVPVWSSRTLTVRLPTLEVSSKRPW